MFIQITKPRYRFRLVVPAYPTFNVYSNIADKTTCLGPVYVATNVNKLSNWDAEIIDENNLGKYGPRGQIGADHGILQTERPADVIGLYGGLTSTIPRLYKIAQYYKNLGVITIAGGQHFVEENIMDALLNGIDYVIIGEGEDIIKELLNAIEGKCHLSSINGIAYLDNGKFILTPPRDKITKFDDKPLPDFSLVRYANIKIFPVERIRGCGMDCEFCTVKGKPRAASVERLMEQIRYLVETRDARQFFIVDDLFGQHREETIEFCNYLNEYQMRIGKKFDITVQIRLDKSKDKELLRAMRRAHINMVCIGYESPIAEELAAMHKHINPREMLAMTKEYRKHGFFIHGMFIFGYPLDNNQTFVMPAKERVTRYIKFIKEARIDTIQILLPVPLPGTEFRKRLKLQNRVYDISDVGWEYYDGNFPLFEPDYPLTAEDMQVAQKQITTSFYGFNHFFKIVLNILTFPALILFLDNIRYGWRKWYRSWRNNCIRIMGWSLIREWNHRFNKDMFYAKLHIAKDHILKKGGVFHKQWQNQS